MAVAASAGTVNTGAVDPLEAIRQVCDRHSVWMHVDGAAFVNPRMTTPDIDRIVD